MAFMLPLTIERSTFAKPFPNQWLWHAAGKPIDLHRTPSRRPRIVALVALLLAACSAGAEGATVAAPNAALSEVFSKLRGSTEAEVKDSAVTVEGSAQEILQDFKAHVQERVSEVEREHKSALDDINGPAEASLRQVKHTLNMARLKAADQARDVVKNTVASVQRAAEKEAALLTRRARELQAEAQQRKAEANHSAVATQAAVAGVSSWVAQWPRAEINSSIGVANAASARASQMHGFAANATALDAQIDAEAMETLHIVQEAVLHSQRAAVDARTAVDQAAQNAIKLKTLRELISGASAASTTAEEGQIEAILAR
mmetsp:Transcript_18187/g.45346  ORF Transcript_18187/g.45346 Transcript_18187/m.45346 type:complete len:316 (-) Transcript_18187:14-961(-)